MDSEEPAKRAFSDNGEELFDLDQVLDDDLVYISTGPGFIVRKSGGTGGGGCSQADAASKSASFRTTELASAAGTCFVSAASAGCALLNFFLSAWPRTWPLGVLDHVCIAYTHHSFGV